MAKEYETAISNFREINSRSFIANSLFLKLVDKFRDQSASIKEILEYLKRTLSNIPLFPTGFLDKHFDKFAYEVVLGIYNIANISLQEEQDVTTYMGDCLDLFESDMYTREYLQQQFSRKKSSILESYKTMKYPATFCGKVSVFHQYMDFLKNDKEKKFRPLLSKIDFVYNIESFSEMIYNADNFDKGINSYSILTLLSKYIEIHEHFKEPEFQREYSAYQFELLHHVIQFQRMFSSYVEMFSQEKKFSDEYFPLFIYTKLFDTPYLSLTDYIVEKYCIDYKLIYGENGETGTPGYFYEMQLFNNFWLPILEGLVQEMIYDFHKADFQKIMKICHDYIVESAKEYGWIFQETILEAKDQLSKIEYLAPKNYNTIKIDDKRARKTDRPLHHWNCIVTKCFYENDIPKYLMNALMSNGYMSLDGCYQYIDSLYRERKRNTSIMTLKTCPEYSKR